MASVYPIEKLIAVLPEDWDGTGDIAHCLMFCEWEHDIGPEWLDLAEEIFAEFGLTPHEGTGNLGETHSHGSYKRVRNRLRRFLESHTEQDRDFGIQAEPHRVTESFFPSDIRMTWNISRTDQQAGILAVRYGFSESCQTLIERVGDKIFGRIGVAYGAAFDFPVLYGPGYYLASLSAVPRGTSSVANESYTARLTRWRDSIRHLGLRARQGYFREIYPINFVLDVHLGMPFQGRPLSDYMERVGDLRPSCYAEGMYCWHIPADRLEAVRLQLEPSGLVLSSATPPLRS